MPPIETPEEISTRIRAHLEAAHALLDRLCAHALVEVGEAAKDKTALLLAVKRFADLTDAGGLVVKAGELL